MSENTYHFSIPNFGETTNIENPGLSQSESTITIDGEVVTSPTIKISDNGSRENVQIAYQDENGENVFSLARPQAELNIFDPEFYLNSNPDVAEDLEDKYEDAGLNIQLVEAELPNLIPELPNLIPLSSIIIDGPGVTFNGNNLSDSILNYTGAINHYVTYGASEGRDPSPLFDIQYYLDNNPDVASALAGGSFDGDPLLHYVSAGASEGRDPNPFFDSDYYIEQNPEVQQRNLNPLEHYVLFGSSSGVDPSPNFDSDYYLSQNPDVAAAGIDPLTHFLTFGQEEGRLPIAE